VSACSVPESHRRSVSLTATVSSPVFVTSIR
jgi:hypothetical protein